MNTSPPSKPILILACCILGSFFMPWFQLLGVAASGYDLGRLGSYGNYAWIVPILSGATIVMSLNGYNNRLIGALTGIIPLGVIMYGINRLGSEGGEENLSGLAEIASHVLSVGGYVTIICCVAIVIAANVPPRLDIEESERDDSSNSG